MRAGRRSGTTGTHARAAGLGPGASGGLVASSSGLAAASSSGGSGAARSSGRSGAHSAPRRRRGISKPAALALAAVVALAGAGTAAYEVAGRGRAHAGHPPVRPHPAPVTLEASASPPSLPYGGSVSVAATLVDAAGVPVEGAWVEVLSARVDVPSNAAIVASGATDAAGRYAATFRPAASANVWLRFAGTDAYAPAVSLVSRVDVVPKVTLAAAVRPAAAGGWVATLTGSLSPAPPGSSVRIERRTGATWRLEAIRPLSAAGTFTFAKPHATTGTFTYRAVRRGDASFGEGTALADVKIRPVAAPAPAPRPPSAPGPAVGVGGAGAGPRLLVTGDSFAYFLGQQLQAARRGLVTVVDSKHSSGLTRPDFFDWNAYAARQVATHVPSAVVVFLGANDCQPVRRNGNGEWAPVGSAGWSAEYQRRAAELMRTYSGNGARRVYWLGLPVVKAPDIAACYRSLNAATEAAAQSVPGVTWRGTWSLYAVDGQYSDYVQGVLARQEDGIHFTFAGTKFATRMVLALLG